ncbi:hypothetical protein [Priestia sp. TSO9]|uniref:hypothetical protein n=1 Tax=Priestia sp. TSO9 TaxID=2885632 RepID=UPI001E2ABF53|nr:hypothetical protein [Priestia sp. TSO9]
MYYYNYYNSPYQYPSYQYPYAPRPAQYKVTTDTIKNALQMHHGECFGSYWKGKDHIFNLTGLDADGTVHIIENGEPNTVHQDDMVEFKYIGVKCPTSTTGPDHTMPPPPPPPTCRWVMTPYGNWVWYCP